MVDLTRLTSERTPNLSRGVVPEETLRVPEFQGSGARYLGRATEQLGDATREFANAYNAEQLRSQRFQMNSQLEDFHATQQMRLPQMARESPAGLPNFTQQYVDQFDKTADGLRANIPPGMEVEFNAKLAKIRRQQQVSAYGTETNARDLQEKEQLTQLFNRFAVNIDGDPSQRADLEQRAIENIRASGLSPELKFAMERSFSAQAAEAEFQNLRRTNPHAAEVALGGRNRVRQPNQLAMIGRIQSEAKAMGYDDAQVQAIVGQFYIENSKFDPTARTASGPGGSYVFGLGQTTRALREKYGITEDVSDPDFIKKMIRGSIQAMDDHAKEYGKLVGKNPSDMTPGERYLSYFQGPAGLQAITRANSENPNIRVTDALAAGVSPRHAAMVAQFNPMLRNMTVGQLINWSERRMNNAINATGGVANHTIDDSDPRFSNIPYERRQSLLGQARAEGDRVDQEQFNITTYQDRELHNATFKTMLDAVRQGKFNEEWLTQNRNNLSAEHYNAGHRILTKQDTTTQSDPAVYAELTRLAGDPDRADEVTLTAMTALGNNQLNQADYQYIIRQTNQSANAENRSEATAKGRYARTIADSLRTSLMPNVGGSFNKEAINEARAAGIKLNQWYLENRNASEQDIVNRAEEIHTETVASRNTREAAQVEIGQGRQRALAYLGVTNTSNIDKVLPAAFAKAYNKLNDDLRSNKITQSQYTMAQQSMRDFEKQASTRRSIKGQ